MDFLTEFDNEDRLTKFEVVCEPWHKLVTFVKDT